MYDETMFEMNIFFKIFYARAFGLIFERVTYLMAKKYYQNYATPIQLIKFEVLKGNIYSKSKIYACTRVFIYENNFHIASNSSQIHVAISMRQHINCFH